MPIPRIVSTTTLPHTDLIATRCPSPTRTSSSASPQIVGIPQWLEPCATSAHHGLWLAPTVATQGPLFSGPTIATSASRSVTTRATLHPPLMAGVLSATSTRSFCRTSAAGASRSATTSAHAMVAISRATTALGISPTRLSMTSGAAWTSQRAPVSRTLRALAIAAPSISPTRQRKRPSMRLTMTTET